MHITRFGKIFSYLSGIPASTVSQMSEFIRGLYTTNTSDKTELKSPMADILFCDYSLDTFIVPEGSTTISSNALVYRGDSSKEDYFDLSTAKGELSISIPSQTLHTLRTLSSYSISRSNVPSLLFDWTGVSTVGKWEFTIKYAALFNSNIGSIVFIDGGAYDRHWEVSLVFEPYAFAGNCTCAGCSVGALQVSVPFVSMGAGAVQNATFGSVSIRSVSQNSIIENLSIASPGFCNYGEFKSDITESLSILVNELQLPSACFYNNSMRSAYVECQNSDKYRLPDSSFRSCVNLAEATVKGNFYSAGDHAFEDCISLYRCTLDNNYPTVLYFELGDYCFSGCSALKIIAQPDYNNTVDESRVFLPLTTVFGDHCFYGCSGIEYVYAIRACTIGDFCFSGCSSLITVELGYFVDNTGVNPKYGSIGMCAFNDCPSLSSITIPGSFLSLGDFAFYGSSIKSIELEEGVTEISPNVIKGDFKTAALIPPTFYYTPTLESITIPRTITRLPEYVFLDTPLNRVIINGSGLKTIAEGAFKNTVQLRSIALPESVEQIEDYAFYNSGLDEFNIPSKVAEINNYVFAECKNLDYIRIPSTVGLVDYHAFSGSAVACMLVDNVTTNRLHSYSDISLSVDGCRDLKCLHLSDGVTLLEHALDGCRSLQYVCSASGVKFEGALLSETLPNLEYIYIGNSESEYSKEDLGIPDNVQLYKGAALLVPPPGSVDTGTAPPQIVGKCPIPAVTDSVVNNRLVSLVYDESLDPQRPERAVRFDPSSSLAFDSGVDITGDFEVSYWYKTDTYDPRWWTNHRLWTLVGDSDEYMSYGWSFGINSSDNTYYPPPSDTPYPDPVDWDLSRADWRMDRWNKYTFRWYSKERRACVSLNNGSEIAWTVSEDEAAKAHGRLHVSLRHENGFIAGVSVRTTLDSDVQFPCMEHDPEPSPPITAQNEYEIAQYEVSDDGSEIYIWTYEFSAELNYSFTWGNPNAVVSYIKPAHGSLYLWGDDYYEYSYTDDGIPTYTDTMTVDGREYAVVDVVQWLFNGSNIGDTKILIPKEVLDALGK